MKNMTERILTSACLAGFDVRYNNTSKPLSSTILRQWHQEGRLIVHCPELAAGLDTPRLPAELVGGKGEDVLSSIATVLESDGSDVTQRYLLAAWLTLETVKVNNCRFALMTDGSPTCGSQNVYDGSFQGTTVDGQGIAVALLRQHGIEVFAEHQITELDVRIREIENSPTALSL